MGTDNVGWYLGPGRAGITEPIVAVERYHQSGLTATNVTRGTAAVVAITLLVGSPLLILGRVGVLLLVGLVVVVDRAIRRLRRKPNDVLMVLTDRSVYALAAITTLRRGWVVRQPIAQWPIGAVHALALDTLGQAMHLRPPGLVEELALTTPTPSPEAKAIAAAVRGPATRPMTWDRNNGWRTE